MSESDQGHDPWSWRENDRARRERDRRAREEFRTDTPAPGVDDEGTRFPIEPYDERTGTRGHARHETAWSDSGDLYQSRNRGQEERRRPNEAPIISRAPHPLSERTRNGPPGPTYIPQPVRVTRQPPTYFTASPPRDAERSYTPGNYVRLQFIDVLEPSERPEPDCPICREPYNTTDHAAVRMQNVGCDHVFGRDCLEEWVNSRMPNSHRCPSCRRDLDPALRPEDRHRSRFPREILEAQAHRARLAVAEATRRTRESMYQSTADLRDAHRSYIQGMNALRDSYQEWTGPGSSRGESSRGPLSQSMASSSNPNTAPRQLPQQGAPRNPLGNQQNEEVELLGAGPFGNRWRVGDQERIQHPFHELADPLVFARLWPPFFPVAAQIDMPGNTSVPTNQYMDALHMTLSRFLSVFPPVEHVAIVRYLTQGRFIMHPSQQNQRPPSRPFTTQPFAAPFPPPAPQYPRVLPGPGYGIPPPGTRPTNQRAGNAPAIAGPSALGAAPAPRQHLARDWPQRGNAPTPSPFTYPYPHFPPHNVPGNLPVSIIPPSPLPSSPYTMP